MQNRITNRKVFERYMPEAEEKRLFAHLNKLRCPYARRDLGWMLLVRHTGIRVGSLVGLTVGDARRAQETGYLVVEPGNAKGERGYQVYCNKAAHRALRLLLSVRRDLGRSMSHTRPLLAGRQGGHVTRRLLQSRMRHWCKAAGLAIEASPHWLRHTLAKRIMKDSTARDPRAVCQLALGHMDPRSTWIYTLPDRDDVENAMREVE